jgi:hypothetical protein
MNGMILHTGAEHVSRDQVLCSDTPQGTSTWFPISHKRILETTETFLEHAGLRVVDQSHGLTRGAGRYFGMLEVEGEGRDYSLVIGLRNSHDKKFPAGLCVGANVFVCDNLSFSGEINLARKHTRFINRDLPGLIARAVGKLGDLKRHQDQRIAAYKMRDVGDVLAHDLVVRAVDRRVMPISVLPKVLKEWREPRHEEFQNRNGWSLFNAFTEALKGRNIAELPGRTQRLHGLFDATFCVAG